MKSVFIEGLNPYICKKSDFDINHNSKNVAEKLKKANAQEVVSTMDVTIKMGSYLKIFYINSIERSVFQSFEKKEIMIDKIFMRATLD